MLSYAKGDKCKLWCGVSLNDNVTTVQSNTKPIICSTVICTKDTTYMVRNKTPKGFKTILCLIYIYILYYISL